MVELDFHTRIGLRIRNVVVVTGIHQHAHATVPLSVVAPCRGGVSEKGADEILVLASQPERKGGILISQQTGNVDCRAD